MNRFTNLSIICLALLCAWGTTRPLGAQTANAVVSVQLANTLPANDDDSTDAVPLNIGGTGGINFFGQTFTQVYVNNNGNLTFGDSLSDFTPNALSQGVTCDEGDMCPIIAPFFADVDTTGTGSGLVQYGNATVNGFNAFVANYINVGYFASETDKLNSFQVALIDRSDTGAGNFDIEFNYNQILWETGDASGGTDGLGGTPVAVGYSNGLSGSNNVYFQLTGSLVSGALLDGGPDGLTTHSLNSGGVLGRYIFPVRQGAVTLLPSSVVCVPGLLGKGAVSTCTLTLTGNAPTGGATVTLSSNNASLTVPASVTVAAGANSATFTATAAATIASSSSATVTATLGGLSQTGIVNLTNAVQSGYIGVFYNSTPPTPCPASLTLLCAANNSINNDPDFGDGTTLFGPAFVFVNTSGTSITNAVITLVGLPGQYPTDSYAVGTIAANSSVNVVPGISNDGQNHPDDGFFAVTGSVYDSADNAPNLNSTQFKFTGQLGGTQIVSVDICGSITAPTFTPGCTVGPSNDGMVPNVNFLGGPDGAADNCDNCFGPAIVALLGSFNTSTGPATITITTTTLTSDTVLASAVQTLTATGGTSPYTWTLVGGSLPPGLGLSSTGTLSGTPTKPGSYSFSVKVTDATGASAVETITLTITAQTLTITTPSPLPSGMARVQYPQQVLSASGGNPPYTFSVPANSLPAGLTLTPGGAISGTPTSSGNSTFTLTVTDSSYPTAQTGSASLSLNVRPFSADLITSAGSLSFGLAAGATTLPLSQTVQVESTEVTTVLSWSTTVSPAESWLSVSPGGTTPGAFTVSLTSAASSLAASATPYRTTISVACVSPSPCAGSVQPVTVSLLVSTVSPDLTALTDLLSFTTSAANPQTTAQSLGLQNAGGGSITITSVTCGLPFCTVGVGPASLGAGATGSITVHANPSGLAAGYYFTAVTVVSSAGTITVPVTFFIATNPSLVLEPSGVLLFMPAGGVAVNPDSSFGVGVSGAASGSSAVAFTAAILPGAPWLTLSTTSGTATSDTPGSIAYSINQTLAAALTPQAYYGTIRVTSAGAMNSPQDFQVVLNVTAANAPQAPNPTPAGLIFLSSGGSMPQPQPDTVFASSVTAVAYQASASTTSGGAWLSVSPATGTTSASAPARTNVSVNPAGLAAGVYRGSVSYSLAAAAVPTVNVTLVVETSGAAAAQRTGGAFNPQASTACTPTQIIATQTALVNDFAAPASWPTPLEIQVSDDCGNAVSNGQVVAFFSNGDAPLALSPETSTSGLYSGTWTPHATGSQVVVTATATAPGFAPATTQISGAVAPNVAPTLNVNGTLDAFAIAAEPGLPVAPGTIVAIYGSGLAAQTIENVPVATNLGGTSVIIGGLAAPLYFVSPGQINAQVPFDLTAGQQYQLIVSANGALTAPQTIQLTQVTPGIAAYPSGFALAQHNADGSLITQASPARPDEYVIIYLLGMGPTTVPVASGAVSPSSPLAYTSDMPTVTLNGETVSNVPFSGLTPTVVGLYQIDFQIPADAANGDLTLVVTQSGFQGSVILPVHN